MDMPKSLCAFGGLDAVTHAWKLTCPYWLLSSLMAGALQALKLLKENLPASYNEGSKTRLLVNVFIVLQPSQVSRLLTPSSGCVTLWRTNWVLSSTFRTALANALLICNVIRYNANDNPTKQTAFSQYDRPQARRRYAEIADHLGLTAAGDRTAAKIEKLLTGWKASKLNWAFRNPFAKRAFRKQTSSANVDKLSEDAFDDQCTGANPRYPLISELETNPAGYVLRP